MCKRLFSFESLLYFTTMIIDIILVSLSMFKGKETLYPIPRNYFPVEVLNPVIKVLPKYIWQIPIWVKQGSHCHLMLLAAFIILYEFNHMEAGRIFLCNLESAWYLLQNGLLMHGCMLLSQKYLGTSPHSCSLPSRLKPFA